MIAFAISISLQDIDVKTFLSAETINPVNVYLFYVDGCANCATEEEYLLTIQEEYENVQVIRYEVSSDSENAENVALLSSVADVFNEDQVATPFTIIGGKHFVGFNDNVEVLILKYIEKYSNQDYVDIMAKIINGETIVSSDFDNSSDTEFTLPLIGTINVKDFSIVVISIVLGLVDGFNPCAMWVLLFLVGILSMEKKRYKLLLLGSTFIITSALFYFTIMMAWINTVEIISEKTIFQIAIGIIAILAGAYSLYKYFKAMKSKNIGCEVTNEKQHTKIIDKIIKIAKQKNIVFAMFGIIVLAIIVNFIELACSTGLPVLFSQILVMNNIGGLATIGYVLLYILFFLLDDLIVFFAVVITMHIHGLSNRFSKYSHLIGGIIMIIIGFLSIFFPNIITLNF